MSNNLVLGKSKKTLYPNVEFITKKHNTSSCRIDFENGSKILANFKGLNWYRNAITF